MKELKKKQVAEARKKMREQAGPGMMFSPDEQARLEQQLAKRRKRIEGTGKRKPRCLCHM